ncbi:MAG: hypothetical protein ACI4M6_00070 [Christensenellaceae bacterium]
MKKDKLSEIIENNCPDVKESKEKVWDRLVAKTGYEEKKERKIFNWKYIVAPASFLLIICLTIPVIISFSMRASNVPQYNGERFYPKEDYSVVSSENNLSKLAQQDENVLFLNWNVLETFNYVDKKSNKLLCINDYLFNETSGIKLKIFVGFPDCQIDFIENQRKFMTETTVISDISVNYTKDQEQALAYLQYNQYTYYFEFVGVYKSEEVFATISELLNCKN